jgi:hypothetical protein
VHCDHELQQTLFGKGADEDCSGGSDGRGQASEKTSDDDEKPNQIRRPDKMVVLGFFFLVLMFF